ncbi:MAG: universal stress protein [Spiribacter sp.]|jgi:nucleotide-binding universal stress UspA family protein|nr:universal stress protein [Spiribacter sp.]MDR9489692.1 universal stress protein [Spiribacter sp.]
MTISPSILLVPVDGSEGASAAVRYAAGLASGLEVPVRLLFAFPNDPVEMFGVPTEAPHPEELEYFSPEAFARLREQSARKVFDAARKAIEPSSIVIEESILSGAPAEAIVEHAASASEPMVVMGNRGLSGIKGLLLGSVSQRVLHHAQCPVTVVR